MCSLKNTFEYFLDIYLRTEIFTPFTLTFGSIINFNKTSTDIFYTTF